MSAYVFLMPIDICSFTRSTSLHCLWFCFWLSFLSLSLSFPLPLVFRCVVLFCCFTIHPFVLHPVPFHSIDQIQPNSLQTQLLSTPKRAPPSSQHSTALHEPSLWYRACVVVRFCSFTVSLVRGSNERWFVELIGLIWFDSMSRIVSLCHLNVSRKRRLMQISCWTLTAGTSIELAWQQKELFPFSLCVSFITCFPALLPVPSRPVPACSTCLSIRSCFFAPFFYQQ